MSLESYVENLMIGEVKTFKNMDVFSIFGEIDSPIDYIILDEAFNKGLIEIREKNDQGRVPEIKFINKSEDTIFMMDGEELRGAKQNRATNISVLVPPYSSLIIPVSCVEERRWNYKSENFQRGEVIHPFLRGINTENVTNSLVSGYGFTVNQSEVWNEITRKTNNVGYACSPTGALSDVFEQRKDDLDDYLDEFDYRGENGLIICINGEAYFADIFDKPQTMEYYWDKLIRSYALDAIEHYRGWNVRSGDINSFIVSLKKGRSEAYESVGLGEDLRIKGVNLNGAALVYNNAIIHMGVFGG